MNAQPGLRLDCTTRFLIPDRSIYPQWVSPHDEAGDFKPRRNWENFPNHCIWSLMMKFPNKEDTLLFRMVSQLSFECKQGNIPSLIRSKILFRPPKLVFTYDMWLQASLGIFRFLLLLELMDFTSSLMLSLGAVGGLEGKTEGISWDCLSAHSWCKGIN